MVVMHMGIFYCEAANSENSANVDRVCIGPLLDVIIAVWIVMLKVDDNKEIAIA